MHNAFLQDFYFSLKSTVQQRTKKPDKNHGRMHCALLCIYWHLLANCEYVTQAFPSVHSRYVLFNVKSKSVLVNQC